MMKYGIGLDVGIASVGSCVMSLDSNGEPISIEQIAVRAFDEAENKKDGSSLCVPRRDARSSRRRLRRRNQRIADTKKLIEKHFGSQTLVAVENARLLKTAKSVYELRVEALTKKLQPFELCQILLLFVKRRGFKSTRKADLLDKKKDDGRLLAGTKENQQLLQSKGYATIGEMIFSESKYTQTEDAKKILRVRNSDGCYDKTFFRSDIESEIKVIFEKQKCLGFDIAEEFCEQFLQIFNRQRGFDEGPGSEKSPSKYRKSFAVGYCTFENGEIRAPKASYTYEYANMLIKVNSLKLKYVGGVVKDLTKEQRDSLVDYAKHTVELKFSQIRKKLGLQNDSNVTFNLLSYSYKKPLDEVEKAKFVSMENSTKIKKALSDANSENIELIDEIAKMLSFSKSDSKIKNEIAKNPILSVLSEDEIEELLALSFYKFGNLSIVALKKLIPFLEQGATYDKACQMAGYEFRGHSNCQKTKLLNTKEIWQQVSGINAPVVKRAVSQTIKVINAIVLKYGSPYYVNIELSREMAKNFKERKEIEKDMALRFEGNQKAMESIKSDFSVAVPTGQDLIKYKLYNEQGGKCAYSSIIIDSSRLFEPNYVQIDHIIPYSRSFNDSYNNKVLVHCHENQNKRDRTPYEYFGNDTAKWAQFENFVTAQYSRNRAKKDNLLKKTFTMEEQKAWKERSLNDTKYITKFLFNLIKDNLQMSDEQNGAKKRVRAVNGQITSYARKLWGIQKFRADGDLHHGKDAVVVACITDGIIQKLSALNKFNECRMRTGETYTDEETGEVISFVDGYRDDKTLKAPYHNFSRELELRLSENPKQYENEFIKLFGYESQKIEELKPVFVSRMSNKKYKGELHEATIRRKRVTEKETLTISKVAISKLKLDKDGEIANYYDKESDTLLYNALKEQLKKFDGSGEKAFQEPFYKPKADGTNGNIVKKVKTVEKSTLGFDLQKTDGYASNSSMARLDVYEKDGKFYCVPVYVSDIYAKRLPTKACVAFKSYDEWIEMDKSYSFKFSLHSNELIYFEHKSGVQFSKNNVAKGKNSDKKTLKDGYVYYKSFGISVGAARVITHDNSYFVDSLGLKTLRRFEKCVVDVLGNINFVKGEKDPR